MSLESDGEASYVRGDGPLAFVRDVERQFLAFVEDHSIKLLRYSLVVVFVWFGILTATGMSPTAGLVAEAFQFVPADVFFVGLGAWEIAVGLALLFRRTLRLAAVLLVGYAAVAMVPLVLFPGETFSYFPYGPSFEGVYILKDWVLLGGAMTVAGTLDSST